MGRKKPLRLNFPIFSIISHKDHLLVSGGAGKEFGIENKLAIYKDNTPLKDLVVEIETKKDLIENLHSNKKVDLISCNSGRFCLIYKFDIAKGTIEEVVRFVTDTNGQNASAFNSKADAIATAGEDGIIKFWKLSPQGNKLKATEALEIKSHTACVNNLNISADDKLICSASDDKTCRVFNLENGDLLKRLTFGEESQNSNLKFALCYFSLDHEHVYTIQNSERNGPAYFTIWDIQEGFEPVKTTKVHKMAVTSSALNDQGNLMGLGTVDGCSKVLDIKKLEINCEVEAHDLIVKSVCFADKSRYLVSASADYSFFFLRNTKDVKWFSLLFKMILFVLVAAAIALFARDKYKIKIPGF